MCQQSMSSTPASHLFIMLCSAATPNHLHWRVRSTCAIVHLSIPVMFLSLALGAASRRHILADTDPGQRLENMMFLLRGVIGAHEATADSECSSVRFYLFNSTIPVAIDTSEYINGRQAVNKDTKRVGLKIKTAA